MTPDPTTDPPRTVEHGAGDRTPPDAPAAVPDGSSATVHAPSQVSLALAPFPVVAGYSITAEIAKGGMGCVYAGHDLSLDREVAIKTLLPTANADRFVTEAKITARLPHPNIPPVYAFGRLDDGSPYLAMKCARGRTLADQLAARTSPADDLPRFVSIFEQIAQAVGFAHAQGVLHRDLKPADVMVGSFGEVQVMDWGLAKRMGANEEPSTEDLAADSPTVKEAKTRAGQIMGTPAYMAPRTGTRRTGRRAGRRVQPRRGAGGKSAEEIALRKRTFEATRKAVGDRPHATWEDAARLLTACRTANDYSAIAPDAKTLPAALVALLGSDPNGLVIQRRTAAKMRPYAVATEPLAPLARSRFETFGELHPVATAAVVDLADLSREAGTPAAAVPALERVVARMEKEGFKHPNASAWVNELADALEACARAGDAEAWRRKWLAVVAGATGAESLSTAGARAALGLNLLQQQKWEDAETVLRACLTVREKHAPNGWQTDNTRSMVGGALLGQKKFAEAEPLLRTGYEGMLKRESVIPPPGRSRLGEAVDRLIELATAKDDAEAVKRWKAERARYLEVAPVPRARN